MWGKNPDKRSSIGYEGTPLRKWKGNKICVES